MKAARLVTLDTAALLTYIDHADDPDAPWIILSNSLAADREMWEPQVPFLRPHYNILRYDTRGHGGSTAPSGPYAMSELVGDVIDLFDFFDIEKATFMGLSMGGMTGLGLALHYPERLNRLICCDARADAPAPFRQSWDARNAEIDAGGMRGILAGTVERWLHPDFRAANPDRVKAIESMILATAPEGYKACAEALKKLDYRKRMPEITVPSLFVVGEADIAATPAVMQDMADAVPGSGFAVIPDAAHLSNLDNSVAFNTAIGEFLEVG